MNTTLIFVLIALLVAVGLTLKKLVDKPKWQLVYFKTVIEINAKTDPTEICDILVERYKLTPQQAMAAVEAAKEGDEEWFKQYIN